MYSATIVPDAPKSGDHTDDYDDAIGADEHRAKSGNAAHADGGDHASHRIEQGLRRLTTWWDEAREGVGPKPWAS